MMPALQSNSSVWSRILWVNNQNTLSGRKAIGCSTLTWREEASGNFWFFQGYGLGFRKLETLV